MLLLLGAVLVPFAAAKDKPKLIPAKVLQAQTILVVIDPDAGELHYRGSATLKQTDFGIKPISIGGGMVKVKDEVKIDFDFASRP
jgi:hypothetical protein